MVNISVSIFIFLLATGFVTVLKPICMADILQAVSRVHPLCLLCSWLFVGGLALEASGRVVYFPPISSLSFYALEGRVVRVENGDWKFTGLTGKLYHFPLIDKSWELVDVKRINFPVLLFPTFIINATF